MAKIAGTTEAIALNEYNTGISSWYNSPP